MPTRLQLWMQFDKGLYLYHHGVMKKVLIVVCVVVVLAVAGLGWSLFSINGVVKNTVEKVAPLLTQSTVTIKSVSLSPFSGSGTISGLVIGNPSGFKTEHAIAAGKIEMEVDVKSLASDCIVIKKLILEEPDIICETSFTGSNLTQLQTNIQSFTPKTSQKSSKKVRIDLFAIQKGKIKLGHQLLSGNAVPAPLPDLELKDIGKDVGGIAPENAFGEILKSVALATAQTANPAKAVDGAVDGIKNIFQ